MRLGRLIVLSVPLRSPVAPEDRRLISYVVIEAANLWAQYSRCLFLSCAFGARDAHGQPTVASRAATLEDALTLGVHAVTPRLRGKHKRWRRQELPDFQNKGHLAKVIQYLGASVGTEVNTALGYQSRVLADLPTMRNYFAHKSEEGATGARNLAPRYGLSRALSPEVLLCSVPRSRGDIILREWLADLYAILTLMP